MIKKLKIKQSLYNYCKQNNSQRISTLEERLKSLEESRDNETKSSAGDKFETGRAMMQTEVEKIQRQLSEAHLVGNRLAQIDVEQENTIVAPGSLIETDQGTYFMAIGMGKIPLDGSVYYGISTDSPIGQIMLYKTAGDDFYFNEKRGTILRIF